MRRRDRERLRRPGARDRIGLRPLPTADVRERFRLEVNPVTLEAPWPESVPLRHERNTGLVLARALMPEPDVFPSPFGLNFEERLVRELEVAMRPPRRFNLDGGDL